MASIPNRPTLYEDWKARCEQLAQLPRRAGDRHAIEAQILDYLLRRYRDTPEGNRPAKSPLIHDVYVNHRAIVVMRHLGGGAIPTIATPREAQAHVQSVLQRMLHGAGSAAPSAGDEARTSPWIASNDPADVLRMRLCDNHRVIRVLAALKLGGIGTLDDIGLFFDLLALPPSADEHPRERAAMIHSMWRLAGRTPEPFDLSDVIGPSPIQGEGAPSMQDSEPAAEMERPDWKCSKCGKRVPGNFQICWKCGTSMDGVEDPDFRRTEEEPSGKPVVAGGRRAGLARLALGLLCAGAAMACVARFSGLPATTVSGLPLSLLLVLVAMAIAAFAWREPGAKVTIALCGLTLAVGVAVARYETTPSSEMEPLDNSRLPPRIQKLVPLHKRLGKPLPGDWLTNHFEVGQTYRQYVGDGPVRPEERRRMICIQPLGDFTPTQRKIVRLSAEFMGIYFQLPVRVCDDLPLSLIPQEARRQNSGSWGPQLAANYILEQVLKPRLPADAVVMIAFTASDLWPGDGWNFVYGWASPTDRVGVWSICRHGDPEESEDAFRLTLRRTLKIATHETAHMFSMRHCIFYECCMGGVNHLEEADRHPLWLCPHCLAKLCYATAADPVKRFEELRVFAAAHGLDREAAFWQKSLAVLQEE